MKIIDCHFHWLPKVYYDSLVGQNGAPRTTREGDGFRYVYGRGKTECAIESVWFDIERQWADMEATGHELILIGSASTLAGDLAELPPDLAVRIARDYNRGMSDAQRRYPGRFWGTALVPLQDVSRSLEILDEAIGELGLKGVNLPPSIGDIPIDAPELEPFYARVEELGVPLLVHAGDNIFGPQLLDDHDGALHFSAGRLFESSIAVLRLVVSGIMERHPQLKIVHFHAGGVLPYMSGRLDKNARRPGLQPPSTYLRRMYADTVAPHAHTTRLAIDFYGIDKVMYGTDYPCWNPAAAFAMLMELELDEVDLDKILRGNAAKLFGIPLHETMDSVAQTAPVAA